MITVSIVGVGRVGGAMALSLPKDRYRIENLIFRTIGDSPLEVANGDGPLAETLTMSDLSGISSDIVLITTGDAEISVAAAEVAKKLDRPSIVYHTSGSLSSAVLGDVKAGGSMTGSIHPLVSISEPSRGPERFPGAFFCIEGDPEAVTTGKQIVADLGGRPFSIDVRFKTLYHAAAVTACGHLVALFDSAVEMMTKCGLTADESKDILLPLVTSTVQNLNDQTTAEALTGTFARADIGTFTRHLKALNENVSDELLEIYLLLGERSLELAARRGASSERIDTLRTKLAIAKSKLKW